MKKLPLQQILTLDADTAEPLYRQIYLRFRGAIAERLLKPGDRIPSARALAEELGIARGTVEAAYSLLGAEGYVEPRGQAGTVVTRGLKPRMPAGRPVSPVAGASLAAPILQPFHMGVPALDAFPRKIWARLTARAVRATRPEDMMYPAVGGLASLRTEIATYLQLSRGVACSPAQVFITSGYLDTLQLIARTLLKAGDHVWIEDPAYPPTGELLARAGMQCAPIPVDSEGLDVARGMQMSPRAQAAFVTPAHQSPLCVTLSLPRRFALLEWASRNKAWIVEDDYDGEYRYVSRPLPALKSLDRDGRVLYSGTFSKVLFPGIRLAYLVVPPSEVERFGQASRIFSGGSAVLMQAIVSDFMAQGHFARHVHRMRKLYGERREIAAAGLAAMVGKYLRIDPQPGGMHMVLHLRGRRSDSALAARLRANGLYAYALSERTAQAAAKSALLLGFTNIESESRAEQLGARILQSIER